MVIKSKYVNQFILPITIPHKDSFSQSIFCVHNDQFYILDFKL